MVYAYTRTQIKPTFDSIKTDHKKYLLSPTKVARFLPIATGSDSDKLPVLSKLNPTLLLTENIVKVKELVKVVPELSKTIEYFIENPGVAN
ncbi:hypothetical protein [Ancylomarina sp.]|uniref:hypothetical protein n=1 Tax=Ancylomarina sp. TaxID=1970196 RepID=UPI0035658F00